MIFQLTTMSAADVEVTEAREGDDVAVFSDVVLVWLLSVAVACTLNEDNEASTKLWCCIDATDATDATDYAIALASKESTHQLE